jgi:hypothetical protein
MGVILVTVSTTIYLLILNGPNRLERYITLCWKGVPELTLQLVVPICKSARK